MNRPPNILIFHAAALGDFVLTWPLALALKRWKPDTCVHYVTHHGKGQVAQTYLGVSHSDLETGNWHRLYQPGGELPMASHALLEQSEVVVSFLAVQDDQWTHQVQMIAPHATVISLSALPPAGLASHVTEFYRQQIAHLPDLAAHLDDVLIEIGNKGLDAWRPKPHILIHPGSGSPRKNWPLERYLQLSQQLRQSHDVAFVLGEVELDRWPAELLRQAATVAALVTPGTLGELASEVTSAKMLIGNDSGPGHLAGILGVPVLSLFSATSPSTWQPLGPRVRTLASPSADMRELPPDAVIAAAEALLADF